MRASFDHIGFVNAFGGIVLILFGPIYGKIFDYFLEKKLTTFISLLFGILSIVISFIFYFKRQMWIA